ncbi:cation diffusion facilitator family transporter [Streptacidiphilus sp. ASG 303]|uniref:cation diffusion facilitator family transporter n=1 Tax=Streptacidiphilus sp. ASG 303 TaxID=2896847 RepID=UPI001E62CA60|nr:cation diffusion facilitator family transporter [Streptacidiphilus sp. ASG 303]MCD0483807.1 cation diffusion facilitator family transporter [Streptacidiphilus sp. ASG 303]
MRGRPQGQTRPVADNEQERESSHGQGTEPGRGGHGREGQGREGQDQEGQGRGKSGDGETRGTVLVALLANVVIAVAKVVGGVIAHSPALLSEAAHSVADSLNEVFLLAAVKRSRRRPDARHPFGYGKERYFWSMLAAVGIFVTGGCFSFYQGMHALLNPGSEETGAYAVVYVVLAVSLVAEGTSLAKAVLQVRRAAREHGRGFLTEVREGDDPTVRTVLAEDSTAVLGVVLAVVGVVLHEVTGSSAWEAAASLAIAVLLMYVAYRLGRDAKDLLVGEAVKPGLQQEAHRFLDAQPEIDTVTQLLTMQLGMDSALLAARVDLRAGLDSEQVEEVAVRIKRELREQCPGFEQVFLDITDADHAERKRAERRREDLDRAVARSAGGEADAGA